MKKLLTLTLLAAGALSFTSCTVVEPTPATTSTTTTHETVSRPAATTQTTTTRAGGY